MLCRKMHWTYQQLREQPQEFIDILLLMGILDAEKHRTDNAKAEAAQKAGGNKQGSKGKR